MGNKDKTRDGDATTDRDHSHSRANRDHSQDREAARDATLARTITEAVAQQTQSITEMFTQQNRESAKETQSITEAFTRQMEKAHVQYQDLLKETCTAALPTTLKVTSSTDGFRVMDPFNWTMDNNVYQRWQLWSHKARLALEAMEGDTEKIKISYLHHWLNGEGISKIEGWKNSKILISQEDYDKLEDTTGKYSLDKIESYFSLCELILTPRSNPFTSSRRFISCQARLYDFWRISFSYTQNCKKMSVSKSRGRRESCQRCNFYGYEQSTSKGQGNKSHE